MDTIDGTNLAHNIVGKVERVCRGNAWGNSNKVVTSAISVQNRHVGAKGDCYIGAVLLSIMQFVRVLTIMGSGRVGRMSFVHVRVCVHAVMTRVSSSSLAFGDQSLQFALCKAVQNAVI